MFASITVMRKDVSRRLRRGEHLVLYGPWGSGKTTVVIDLESRFKEAGIRCGRSERTQSLDDIVAALSAVYPSPDSPAADFQDERARLWQAASGKAGILLLDHLLAVDNSMARFLRRLHRGTVGVLSVVDIELEEEQRKLRPWRLGTLAVRIPPESADRLARILEAAHEDYGLPPLKGDFESQLLRFAQGRPGWIHQCIELERNGHYWQDDQLFITQLCEDTDRALRRAASRALGLKEVSDDEGSECNREQ
jgi:hypothetical protein